MTVLRGKEIVASRPGAENDLFDIINRGAIETRFGS